MFQLSKKFICITLYIRIKESNNIWPSLQVHPLFTEPYNSDTIGLYRVRRILELMPNTCIPRDVHSKCLLLPDTYQPGTMDLDERLLSPVPANVAKMMRPAWWAKGPNRHLSKAERRELIREAYSEGTSDGNESPSWIAISLLRPRSDW